MLISSSTTKYIRIITEKNMKFIMQTPLCTRLIKDCQKKSFRKIYFSSQSFFKHFFSSEFRIQQQQQLQKDEIRYFFFLSQQHLNSLVSDEARMMMMMKKRRSKKKKCKIVFTIETAMSLLSKGCVDAHGMCAYLLIGDMRIGVDLLMFYLNKSSRNSTTYFLRESLISK